MHEYSIVQALLERVTQEARARGAVAVDRVSVRIGELAGVDVELLRTAYLTFCERTVCERAALDVTTVPAEWACRECDGPVASGGILRCQACGGAAVLRRGDELLLDRIEMEVP